ncbi:MAG: gliding motility-associated C-terminal domain-containing protein [Ferruginibacter sp.]
MKFKLLLFIGVLFLLNTLKAQTFNGTGASIPDSGSVQGIYPINVNGIGAISSALGLASVCVNINHPWVSDLEISIEAPDGTLVPLSIQNGGSGDDYNGTCFSGTATIAIGDGVAPFNGTFIPDGYIGAVNNGQDANGTWNLLIKDVAAGQTGNLVSWSISFSTNLPPAPPACNGNLPPGNTCAEATPICSFYGFCSATSSSYTADSWPGLDNAFCGTVQNNAFTKFVATAAVMDFSVWVTSSTNHDGIQILFYDGGCGTGTVTEYGCYSPIRPGASPTGITAAGLIPGNTYYMMIDGYAGDECNYIIEPFPAINGLSVTAASPSVCEGKSVQLTATGGNGIYSWTGAGLDTYTGNIVNASPVNNTIYTVSSVDPGGMCPTSRQVSISVITLPTPPTVTDTLRYCQGSSALPLSAVGTNLLWYASAIGGIGNPLPITPSTAAAGINTYYVSQVSSCESQRMPITVITNMNPSLGVDKQKTICHGDSADLTREFNTSGLTSKWFFKAAAIAPPRSVNIAGSYKLEVTNNDGCYDNASIQLDIQPPLHPFAGNDTIAVKGVPHQLHCSSATSYSWSPANLLNNANIQYPQATLNNDQEFIVNITDPAGCTGADTILVKIIKGITYYVPTAFTPNDDGLNDVFRAIPVGIAHTEYFRVINRYGKTIYDSTDPFNKGWDGTYMGYKQPSGTYVWLIKGKDIHGKVVEMKGTVVLIQ